MIHFGARNVESPSLSSTSSSSSSWGAVLPDVAQLLKTAASPFVQFLGLKNILYYNTNMSLLYKLVSFLRVLSSRDMATVPGISLSSPSSFDGGGQSIKCIVCSPFFRGLLVCLRTTVPLYPGSSINSPSNSTEKEPTY